MEDKFVKFTTDLRRERVSVKAWDFYEDTAVGIPFGPECLSITINGEEVEEDDITDNEIKNTRRLACEEYWKKYPEPLEDNIPVPDKYMRNK